MVLRKEKKPVGTTKDPGQPTARAIALLAVWKDKFIWLIFTLAALLMFWDLLSGRCLWQDEAETALLGKNIISFGLPYAWDGTNLVSQENGREFGPGPHVYDIMPAALWRWSPWVQFYLAACGMSVFGYTTFAARLPFAIFGLLTIPLTYLLSVRFFGSRVVGRLSALFLTFSVPFLLHARQARWCSPAYVLLACLLLSLLEISEGKKLGVIGFLASAVLLWHTNFLVALGVLFAVTIAAPIYRPDRRFLSRFGLALFVAGLLILPSLFFFVSFSAGRPMEVQRCFDQLKEYGGEYFTFMLPMLVLGVLIYGLGTKILMPELTADWKRNALFLLTFSLLLMGYLALGPWHFFRYLSVLFPVTSILLALGTFCILRKSFWIGSAAICLLLSTDLIHLFPLGLLDAFGLLHAPGTDSRTTLIARAGPVSFPLLSYLSEIKEPIDDPERIVAQYLNKNAEEGDVVLVSFGQLPIQFYTIDKRLKIRGGTEGQPLPEDPDWAFPRRHVVSWDPNMDGDVIRFMLARQIISSYGDEIRAGKKYVGVTGVRGRDVVLGNCSEPLAHYFNVPEAAPPIRFFRKKKSPLSPEAK
jgi:hypothetical protein